MLIKSWNIAFHTQTNARARARAHTHTVTCLQADPLLVTVLFINISYNYEK